MLKFLNILAYKKHFFPKISPIKKPIPNILWNKKYIKGRKMQRMLFVLINKWNEVNKFIIPYKRRGAKAKG